MQLSQIQVLRLSYIYVCNIIPITIPDTNFDQDRTLILLLAKV